MDFLNKIEKFSSHVCFIDEDDKLSENLEYNEIEEWDSIGHMILIAALEEEFKINLETDDIIEFSSFKKGMSILKKYNVEIS